MNCCALIVSSKLLQLHVPPSRNVQILVITTEVGGNPKEGSVHTKHSEWRPLPYERREKAENRSTKKMQSGGGGGVRRGRYSHMWLLWLGTLQGSR